MWAYFARIPYNLLMVRISHNVISRCVLFLYTQHILFWKYEGHQWQRNNSYLRSRKVTPEIKNHEIFTLLWNDLRIPDVTELPPSLKAVIINNFKWLFIIYFFVSQFWIINVFLQKICFFFVCQICVNLHIILRRKNFLFREANNINK